VHRFLLLVVLALTPVLLSPSAGEARKGVVAAPVPSLEPLATERLWTRLTTQGPRSTQQAPAQCRPLRAVFYAATDWLRLATKLAALRSACAEYYISVPPIVGDKTQMRSGQASRIRALGPNFHALAEIHYTTWNRWVQSTGSTWHQAGVTARQRMAAAGFDVARGDTWVVTESNSAVRRGEGNARATCASSCAASTKETERGPRGVPSS
jgi:hypothetical protein